MFYSVDLTILDQIAKFNFVYIFILQFNSDSNSVICKSYNKLLYVCIEFAINIRGDVTDFDADGYLNASDMEVALKYITNGELEQEELDYITSKIIGR